MLTAELFRVDEINGVLASPSGISGQLHGTAAITGELSGRSAIFGAIKTERHVLTGRLSEIETLTGRITLPDIDAEIYTGDTDITPSDTVRTLLTNGKMLLADITIEPIPSNYGRITWNGSVLTVS